MTSKLEDMLRLHEGVRLHPYRCSAGKLTIGIGRNLDDVGISMEEAELMMRGDIYRCDQNLSSLPFWGKLDIVRKAVLIDMCFNLGFGGLLKFKKMIAAIDVEDFSTAAEEMLDSRWANQVGSRANRLSEMMKTGEWYG